MQKPFNDADTDLLWVLKETWYKQGDCTHNNEIL